MQYRLLPEFANFLPADPAMTALITRVRAPYVERLDAQLATTEGTLYRRGNFNGTFDQLIRDALIDVKGADMAFSPGFRWGTSLLPETATTYSFSTLTAMTGATIKTIMEDVADNLFNPDPYMRLNDKLIDADKTYQVAGWAPVAPGAQREPGWDVAAQWLRAHPVVKARQPNTPRLIGVAGNAGYQA